nr:porin [uncultured bacterium]
MKTVSYLAIAAVQLVCSGSAFAQDAAFDWSGFYAGIHAGALDGDTRVTNTAPGVDPGPFDYSIDGGFGGITFGYNWQAGNVVFGVEGDLGYLDPSGQGIIPSSDPVHHQDLTLDSGLYGDLTGRVGFSFDRVLLYAKGGAAFFDGEAMQASTRPEYAPTGTDTFTGWTAGAGVEYAVTNKISIKAEYQHFDFGEEHGYQTSLVADPPTPVGYRFDNYTTVDFDTFKIGLNYHFN